MVKQEVNSSNMEDYYAMQKFFKRDGIITSERYLNPDILEVRAFIGKKGQKKEMEKSPFYFNMRTLLPVKRNRKH